MELNLLVAELANFLQVGKFQDYCPNGLQVEGRPQVRRIVSGVTASQALIEAAIEADADAVLVHHGYFWRGEASEVTGLKRNRLKRLLTYDLSLLAYHLPLDAHAEVGNNVQLGKVLEWPIVRYLDDKNMLPVAEFSQTMTLSQLGDHVSRKLGRSAQILGNPQKPVQTVAWCTGAAQSYIQQAVNAGVDLFVSGEVSEQTWHTVCETDTAYISAGHHATERYGVQALGHWLAEKYGIEHIYVELDNPV
ncbi:Nif3-like dinuclear metal center hexameric protein [Methylophilus sp. TWE2]|jgi:dinuclear metal center YbgI/SA1388 family protein|uniref:Nif3-like dinuclear metal center hexameric protein n=1 Tax=Methylophilus sp. TWE2 TaxID=1662285 RepID=UPI0006713AC7|nr:Nif3-like dinuclear metal center hexameric protein [Methylophilus sp. TWE2]AKR42421.1 metal-binding protein [Methylophilus sp. TWE2]